MKLSEAIKLLGAERATLLAQQMANGMGLDWERGLVFVFRILMDEPDRVPGNVGGRHDDECAALQKWLQKYKSGMDARASKRISNPPGTIADPLVETLIGSRLTNLKPDDLRKITHAHRLGMSAENILGLMLEEYLSERLLPHGWHCAWGETVKSVDFVHEDGRLLQIKNRSNSENSSSSAVREGTNIEKWYRIKAGRIEYMWASLNRICGTRHLSEEDFVDFVRSIIKQNPGCLAVEKDNSWQ